MLYTSETLPQDTELGELFDRLRGGCGKRR